MALPSLLVGISPLNVDRVSKLPDGPGRRAGRYRHVTYTISRSFRSGATRGSPFDERDTRVDPAGWDFGGATLVGIDV